MGRIRRINVPGPVVFLAVIHAVVTACVLGFWLLTAFGGHPSPGAEKILRVLAFPIGSAGFWIASRVSLGPLFHVFVIVAGLANSLLWGSILGLPSWWGGGDYARRHPDPDNEE